MKNDDVVILLNAVIQDKSFLNGSGAYPIERDVGGVTVFCSIFEPFEHRLPHARLWTDEWEAKFDLPKGFPHHAPVIQGYKGRTNLMDFRLTGDADAFLREVTYAKLLA